MIIGIGTDIIETKRMAKNMKNEQFLKKIFFQSEIDHTISTPRAAEKLAAYFATKESFLKAIGTGITKEFSFKDIEINYNSEGKPYLIISKKIYDYIEKIFGYGKIISHISLSHEKNYSTAVVIVEIR